MSKASRVALLLLLVAAVLNADARSLRGEADSTDAPPDDGLLATEAGQGKPHQSLARVAFDVPGVQLALEEPRVEAHRETTEPIYDDTQPVFLVNVECLDGAYREDADVRSVIDCRNLCKVAPACAAFTYNTFTETCYLAASCDTRGDEVGRISGELSPLAIDIEAVPGKENTSDEVETVPVSGVELAVSGVKDGEEKEEAGEVIETIIDNEVPTQSPDTTSTTTTATTTEAVVVAKVVESREYTLFSDTECAVQSVLAEKRDVTSVQQCQEACDKRLKRCRAFTFNPDTNKCFLVADCHDRRREDGNVSGVEASIASAPFVDEESGDEDEEFSTAHETGEGVETEQPGAEYNLYEGTGCLGETLVFKSGVPSVAACQAWCEKRHWQGCAAFVYAPDRNRCYLKTNCDRREVESDNISGVKLAIDECTVSQTCSTDDPDTVCPEVSETKGEMADPVAGTFDPPYEGIRYRPTYRKRKEYPTCNFQPPRDPLPSDWVEQCIENARGVGFLRERKRRPNDECPAGWFLCKGMCYTLSQRNNRGPERDAEYYIDDFMFVESRCGLCGGARVAFVGDDPDMQRVAAEAARQTINEDKASWVRRFRFLEERNRKVERGRPYQPWHLYVEMYNDDKRKATYQRYYTGEKDGKREPGWDARYRNQEASILCVNTIPRIQQAIKYPEDSNLTMERGCRGRNHHEMWDNDEHRWRPEHHYPFPGH